MLLREKSVHNPNTGSHWTSSLLFAMLRELSPLYNPVSDEFHGNIFSTVSSTISLTKKSADEAARIIQCYSAFMARVEELNMVDVVDAKPLVDVSRTAVAFSKHAHRSLGTRSGQALKCDTRSLDRPGPKSSSGMAVRESRWNQRCLLTMVDRCSCRWDCSSRDSDFRTSSQETPHEIVVVVARVHTSQ